jgi:hypothetical protein
MLKKTAIIIGTAFAFSLAYWAFLVLIITFDEAFQPFRYMGF